MRRLFVSKSLTIKSYQKKLKFLQTLAFQYKRHDFISRKNANRHFEKILSQVFVTELIFHRKNRIFADQVTFLYFLSSIRYLVLKQPLSIHTIRNNIRRTFLQANNHEINFTFHIYPLIEC
ncbi:MAG: hypothetical protein ACI85O_003400 [Saprospiraceae bacterium]|jgi:hypothetical protein